MVLPDSWLTDIFFGGRRQLIFPSFYAHDGRLSLFSDHLLCRTSAPLCLSLFVSSSRSKWNYFITIAFFLRITNRISVLLSVNIIIIVFPKTQIIIFFSWISDLISLSSHHHFIARSIGTCSNCWSREEPSYLINNIISSRSSSCKQQQGRWGGRR